MMHPDKRGIIAQLKSNSSSWCE